MGSTSDFAIHHPSLETTFKGVRHPNSTNSVDVAQFRGIKFASIPGRWRQSRLFESYPDQYDATKHGPSCPQADVPLGIEDILNGFSVEQVKAINIHVPYQFDEFECLNLVVTTPANVEIREKLPVMVCIHGGGNVAGRNASWFNDGGALVARSIKLGKPIVFVGLNYRLGALGWLASQELLEDNRKAGDRGVGNYGFHDAHLGLEWIYRNISPFGGDTGNITLLGESAGSMDVMHQIHSMLPGRFHRAILQSGMIGTPTIGVPSTIAEQEDWYEATKRFVKADSLEAMRQLPATAFDRVTRAVTPVGSILCRFTIDDVHCAADWKDRNAAAEPANFQLLVGDCKDEYTVWDAGIMTLRRFFPKTDSPVSTPQFLKTLFNVVPKSKAENILSAYGFGPEMQGQQLVECIFHVMNDFNFAEPTQRYAETTAAKGQTVYRYLFDELNPFDGPYFKKLANHSLDLPFIYGAPSLFHNVEHPDWETHVHETIQKKFVGFAHGERIWTPLGEENGYFAFGPSGKAGQITKKEVWARRQMTKWEGFEELSKAEKKAFVLACARQLVTLV